MSIKERVINIICDLCELEEFCNEQTLLASLSLDSLSMVILLVRIEEEFEISLDESDMNPYDLISVKDIIDLVEKYGGK